MPSVTRRSQKGSSEATILESKLIVEAILLIRTTLMQAVEILDQLDEVVDVLRHFLELIFETLQLLFE